ncbi:MAG: hypothetical protein HY075_15060, partial [Deltaproteobacteria bacterium]|nr:hypothetical protein [Deltaproteobacteria bacterium]
MRFQLQKAKGSFTGPVLIALAAGEWKKGKWTAQLPAELRARVDKAAARLKARATKDDKDGDGMSDGSCLLIPGVETADEDVLVALLPEEDEQFFTLEYARDAVKQLVTPKTTA